MTCIVEYIENIDLVENGNDTDCLFCQQVLSSVLLSLDKVPMYLVCDNPNCSYVVEIYDTLKVRKFRFNIAHHKHELRFWDRKLLDAHGKYGAEIKAGVPGLKDDFVKLVQKLEKLHTFS